MANHLTKRILIEKAMEQIKKIDSIRGYKCGIKKEDLEAMDENLLLKCIEENKKRFHI